MLIKLLNDPNSEIPSFRAKLGLGRDLMDFINSLDVVLAELVQGIPSVLRSFMVLVTHAGSPVACLIYLSAAIAVSYQHKKKKLLRAGTIIMLVLPLSEIIKELTRRVRPDTLYVEKMLIQSYSFPSGHAFASFLVFGFISYLVNKYVSSQWRWPALVLLISMIPLVGISRIYLGAHFPTDVLAGWALGGIILSLVLKYLAKCDNTSKQQGPV